MNPMAEADLFALESAALANAKAAHADVWGCKGRGGQWPGGRTPICAPTRAPRWPS